MEKPILIAATSLDEHAYGPVRSILEDKGFPAIVYRTDKVLSNEEPLCIDIDGDGELAMSYAGQSIAPNVIGAAWYRKIAAFSLGDAAQDRAKQMYIHNEVKALHDSIWSVYPDNLWLNAPDRMRQTDRKLGQLLLARELGFTIPSTAISSNWDEVESKILPDGGRMVVKMIRGVISDNDRLKALYTTVLDGSKLDAIKARTTPFPGIYQPFVDKYREWRVTAVGSRVFSASIYTDMDAKDDWRKHQLSSAVKFRDEQLPDGIEGMCLQFLEKSGLRFGAFDFIENAEGEMVFLECNPNGQYGWLEEELGFPISIAIADELIKIARSNEA